MTLSEGFRLLNVTAVTVLDFLADLRYNVARICSVDKFETGKSLKPYYANLLRSSFLLFIFLCLFRKSRRFCLPEIGGNEFLED